MDNSDLLISITTILIRWKTGYYTAHTYSTDEAMRALHNDLDVSTMRPVLEAMCRYRLVMFDKALINGSYVDTCGLTLKGQRLADVLLDRAFGHCVIELAGPFRTSADE
jgi:hypothetical protein